MNIKVSTSTYIFLFISVLSGYFEYMIILLLIVFIHECGHYIFCNNKDALIVIYPFGGITILNSDLNISIFKEFIFLTGGILFQIIFFLICYILYNNGYISYYIFSIIYKINYYLISFNFMPVVPLDGGKLLNLILDIFLKYKLSIKISIIISVIFTFIFLIFNNTILGVIITLFLLKSIYLEYSKINIKYNIFLFERYKNKYKFNKTKYIKNISDFKRNYYHIVNGLNEEIVLSKMFDNKP